MSLWVRYTLEFVPGIVRLFRILEGRLRYIGLQYTLTSTFLNTHRVVVVSKVYHGLMVNQNECEQQKEKFIQRKSAKSR